MPEANLSSNTLHVSFIGQTKSKSVSVFDSDFVGNLIHMEALVGTLLKYGNTGKYEPYLAERWIANDKKTIYKFFIKNDIYDESDVKIDSDSYLASLTFLLGIYSKSYNPPVFDLLIGWSEFKKNPNVKIKGLISNKVDNSIEFHFEKSTSGLYEFLSMPYYGYYNLNDFNADGTWKDNLKITASAGYRIISASNSRISINKRFDSKLNELGTFENIIIDSSVPLVEKNIEKNHVFISDTTTDLVSTNLIQTFRSTPTMLHAFELNPTSHILKNIEDRKKIASYLRKVSSEVIPKTNNLKLADGFYKHYDESDKDNPSSIEKKWKLKFLKRNLKNSAAVEEALHLIFKKLKDEFNIEIEQIENDKNKSHYISFNQLEDSFDFRLKSVDIGYKAENWVIKMMFCSKLGISFPDPYNNICKLTNEYEDGRFLDDSQYEVLFEKHVFQDSVVVPLFRSGYNYSLTESIDRSSISQTTNVPRIDLIKKNEF